MSATTDPRSSSDSATYPYPTETWSDEEFVNPNIRRDPTVGVLDARLVAEPEEDPADLRERAIYNLCDELAELLVRKQRAYGPDAITNAPGGPMNGLRVRIFDKHARFQNLTRESASPDWEPLEDTLLDFAGYGVIGTLVARGDW